MSEKRGETLEFFSGFNIKYPEYEVIPPLTISKCSVRCMRSDDEMALKGSFVTSEAGIVDQINKAVWQCMVSKPDGVVSFDDFVSKMFTKDRDALFYGLNHVTYGDDFTFKFKCPECGKTFSAKVKLGECFSIKTWGHDVGPAEYTVDFELPEAPGSKIVLRAPTIGHEAALMSDPVFAPKSNKPYMTLCSHIDHLEETGTNGEVNRYKEPLSLLKGVQTIKPQTRKLLEDLVDKEFGAYDISLTAKVKCPMQHCGHVEEGVELDLSECLFRALR